MGAKVVYFNVEIAKIMVKPKNRRTNQYLNPKIPQKVFLFEKITLLTEPNIMTDCEALLSQITNRFTATLSLPYVVCWNAYRHADGRKGGYSIYIIIIYYIYNINNVY